MYDYVKHHRWATLKVGAVITFALGVTFLAIMFAGSLEKLFIPRVSVFAMVDDVKGLRAGSPVWFSGVEIGAVKSIDFTIQRKVNIEMTVVSNALNYLKKDSRANILTLGLLGDKYVELTPGSPVSESLRAGDTLQGSTQIELQDVVQASQSSIAKISDFVGMLEEILVKVDKGQGTVSKFIGDPAVYDNLNNTLHELSVLVKKIEQGGGTVGRLINDDRVYADLSSSVSDVRLFAESLRGSEGTLNKLVQDPSLYDRFQKASESLDSFTQNLAASRGTLSKLIDDESLYVNLNSASEKLNILLDRIDKGEGVVGSLVNDGKLSSDLKATIADLNGLIRDMKENPKDYFSFSLF
jgi:phospholipid/cholesterol/gamma-HCH transport system substrate-binding protein